MTAPAPFSIIPFTHEDDLPLPTAGPYIVATRTGYYVHRAFHFGRVLVPTNKAPLTAEATPTLWHNIDPLLPAPLLGQALSFFRAIYEARHSEAMVDITWHPEHGYRLFVPPQQATHAGVKCERTPEHYKGQIVGTIHSHCDFDAFHSGTDTHDADAHDGLHITIGDVNKATPSIAIMISVAKQHWNFTLDEISDGPLVSHPHPQWWERYVQEPVYTTWIQQPKPTGAITRKPTSPVITAPTKNRPVLVGGNPPSFYSLDMLLWRYDDIFTNDEQAHITQADELIDEIRDALSQLGISMDTSFSVDNAPMSSAEVDRRLTNYYAQLGLQE